MENIQFVAQLLNLADHFNTNHWVMALQGSFIYNTSVEFINQSRPLEYIERNLLCGEPQLKTLFQKMVNLIICKSKRKLLLPTSGGEQNDFGPEVPIVAEKSGTTKHYFIRAFEGSTNFRY